MLYCVCYDYLTRVKSSYCYFSLVTIRMAWCYDTIKVSGPRQRCRSGFLTKVYLDGQIADLFKG